jgi:hypothetical protein
MVSPRFVKASPSPMDLHFSQGRTVQRFSFEKSFEDQPIGREMETEASETPCP